MNVLLKTRCNKGHLIVYDDRVSVELHSLGIHNENSLPYSQVTGCDVKTNYAEVPFLSKGLATLTVFALGDQKIVASLITVKDAKKAKELIDERLGKKTILLMYFENNLRYDYKLGFGTGDLGYPIRLINDIGASKNALVEMSSNELESKKIM